MEECLSFRLQTKYIISMHSEGEHYGFPLKFHRSEYFSCEVSGWHFYVGATNHSPDERCNIPCLHWSSISGRRSDQFPLPPACDILPPDPCDVLWRDWARYQQPELPGQKTSRMEFWTQKIKTWREENILYKSYKTMIRLRTGWNMEGGGRLLWRWGDSRDWLISLNLSAGHRRGSQHEQLVLS